MCKCFSRSSKISCMGILLSISGFNICDVFAWRGSTSSVWASVLIQFSSKSHSSVSCICIFCRGFAIFSSGLAVFMVDMPFFASTVPIHPHVLLMLSTPSPQKLQICSKTANSLRETKLWLLLLNWIETETQKQHLCTEPCLKNFPHDIFQSHSNNARVNLQYMLWIEVVMKWRKLYSINSSLEISFHGVHLVKPVFQYFKNPI